MRNHQSAHTRCRTHSSIWRHSDSYIREANDFFDGKNRRLVGQRRIAGSRTDASILGTQRSLAVNPLIGSISPHFAPHTGVEQFDGSLCQTVGQRLVEQRLEVVGLLIP